MRLTSLGRRHRPQPTSQRRTARRRPGPPAPAPSPRPARPRSATTAAHHGVSRCAGSAGTTPTPTLPRAQPGPPRRRVLLLLGWLLAAGVVVTSSAARAETVQIVALAQTIDEVLNNIRIWIMGILAGIAIVLFSIAGLRYLLASGDPGENEKAKGAFKAGCIGFGLAALAPLVVEILKGLVGGV